jgi:hypothetical protein
VAERERDDPLLHKRGELLRHPRPPALPRPQDLQPVPLHQTLPAVEARTMDPEHTTGLAHARPRRVIEQPQTVAEEHVIL